MTEIGQLLKSRYLISNLLSGGGFSVTYLAKDTHLPDRPDCVVKQLKISSDDPEQVEKAREFFFNEAQTLRKLGKIHSQIPELLAYFTDDESENFYIVQEFVPGKTLKHILDSGVMLSEPEIIYILKETLEILKFVHSYKVIHLDIKPENLILRDSDYKIALIDFGSVKQVRTQIATSTNQTPLTTTLGTPGYMPCEQSFGRPKLTSDFYALGMVAIQALTGIHPKELEEDLSSGEILWKEKVSIGKELKALLEGMVRYHFKQRYQSAAEISDELDKLSSFYPQDLARCSERLKKIVSDRHIFSQARTNREQIVLSETVQANANLPTVIELKNSVGVNNAVLPNQPSSGRRSNSTPQPINPSPVKLPNFRLRRQPSNPLQSSFSALRRTGLTAWNHSQNRASAAFGSVHNLGKTSSDRLQSMLVQLEAQPKVILVGVSAILAGMLASWAGGLYLQQQAASSRERQILAESRQLADVNLEDAIQKAGEIPPSSPLYDRAVAYIQTLKFERDRDLLTQARLLSSTDLEAAIATIAPIEANSPLYEEALQDSGIWRSELLETHLADSSPTLAELDPQIDIQAEGLVLQYDGSSDTKLRGEEGIRRVAIAAMAVLRTRYTEFDCLIVYPEEGDLQGMFDTKLWTSYKNEELTLEQLIPQIQVEERRNSNSKQFAVSQQL